MLRKISETETTGERWHGAVVPKGIMALAEVGLPRADGKNGALPRAFGSSSAR
jgi:hypothetical protein